MPSPSPDPQSFDQLPKIYDEFGALSGGRLLAYLTDRLPPLQPGSRAVDLGCGTGRHCQLLARHYEKVLAVDVSAPMLDYARTHRPHPNVVYRQQDLTHVQAAEDGEFDLVLSAHTLHHLPDADLDRALEQIRALVRPGGQVILVDIVDKRRQVSRARLRRQATRELIRDLLRRRPVGDAVRQRQLMLTSAIADHITSDVFLTPFAFNERYLRVFPEGTITRLGRARILHVGAGAATS